MVIKTREPSEAFKKQVSDFVPLVRKRRPWREDDSPVAVTDEDPEKDSTRVVVGATSDSPIQEAEQLVEIDAPSVQYVKPSLPQPPRIEQHKKSLKVETAPSKKLITPTWEVDFNKDYHFVFDFLCEKIGTRQSFAISLYLSLYEKAKSTGSATVHATREEIFQMIRTTASSTVTRSIELCSEKGLFERQVFSFTHGSVVAGTYFHLKSPWVNS